MVVNPFLEVRWQRSTTSLASIKYFLHSKALGKALCIMSRHLSEFTHHEKGRPTTLTVQVGNTEGCTVILKISLRLSRLMGKLWQFHNVVKGMRQLPLLIINTSTTKVFKGSSGFLSYFYFFLLGLGRSPFFLCIPSTILCARLIHKYLATPQVVQHPHSLPRSIHPHFGPPTKFCPQ